MMLPPNFSSRADRLHTWEAWLVAPIWHQTWMCISQTVNNQFSPPPPPPPRMHHWGWGWKHPQCIGNRRKWPPGIIHPSPPPLELSIQTIYYTPTYRWSLWHPYGTHMAPYTEVYLVICGVRGIWMFCWRNAVSLLIILIFIHISQMVKVLSPPPPFPLPAPQIPCPHRDYVPWGWGLWIPEAPKGRGKCSEDEWLTCI